MSNKNLLTITLDIEDWKDILHEAENHLGYTMSESEAVDKLAKIIESHQNLLGE